MITRASITRDRGVIWTRDGLTHKQRSLINIAILSTMGKQNELAVHTKGALRNGLTEVEIRWAMCYGYAK